MAQLAIIHAIHDDTPSQIGQAMHDAEQAVDHIVELRAAVDTREMFSDQDEESLWRLVGKLQFVLSSIRIGREAQAAAE